MNFSHEWEAPPNKSLEAVLRAGAERIGWERRTAPGARPQALAAADAAGGADAEPADGATRLRGLGFSFHHAWHAAWQEEARGRVQVGISLNPDGSVVLQAPQVETGVRLQHVRRPGLRRGARLLGVTDDDIEWIATTDTETGLKDMVADRQLRGLPARRGDGQSGRRAQGAAGAPAAGILERRPGDIDVVAGQILVGGEPSGSSVTDILQAGDMLRCTSP